MITGIFSALEFFSRAFGIFCFVALIAIVFLAMIEKVVSAIFSLV